MKPQDLRAYVRRDWAAVERAKLEYWVELARTGGPAPLLRAADAVRHHVARFAPVGTAEARAEDLAHHVALKWRIDAASRSLRR